MSLTGGLIPLKGAKTQGGNTVTSLSDAPNITEKSKKVISDRDGFDAALGDILEDDRPSKGKAFKPSTGTRSFTKMNKSRNISLSESENSFDSQYSLPSSPLSPINSFAKNGGGFGGEGLSRHPHPSMNDLSAAGAGSDEIDDR